MDKFYIKEKNQCLLKIKEVKLHIDRNNKLIDNISKKDIDNYDDKQILKANELIKKSTIELNSLNNRMNDIINRKIDNEYYKLQNVGNVVSKKYLDKEELKKQNSKYLSKSRYIDSNYDGQISEKQLDYEYKRYIKSVETLPYNIKEQLKTLPNNKGYIWFNTWFFGELPSENDNLTMFEKVYNTNKLKIYEFDKDWKYVYEKNGKEKKKFIYKEKRSNFYYHIMKCKEQGYF